MRKITVVVTIIFLILVVLGAGFYFFQKENYTDSPGTNIEEEDEQIIEKESFEEKAVELEYSVVLDVDDSEIAVAVMDTKEEIEGGLIGVMGIEEDNGVLFIFEEEGIQEIDISDIGFSFDVIWLDYGRVILDSNKNVRSRLGRRKIKSDFSVSYAILVRDGWVEDRGVHRGSVVTSEDIPSFASLDTRSDEERSGTPRAPISQTPIAPDGTLPPSILYDVPFTPQAVFGNWDDIRQSNACEEASALMAYRWAMGQGLSLRDAEKTIIAMSDYELANYGHFHDTSAQDTVIRIFNDYLKYDGVTLVYDIDAVDIRRELASGNLVIVPADGRKLGNPYYTAPGPPVHMLVVIGYDDETQEFITNDPGTKRGKSFRYGYRVLENAVADYKSGYKEAGSRSRTAMIVVSSEQGGL